MIRHCDFSRFLLRQLRKRAAGRGHDEQQSQNDTQYAGALLFRQEQNALLDWRSSQTQRCRFARCLCQNRAGVGKALALRQLGGDCLITRQLRVALRANRSKPDERIPPVDGHGRCAAKRPQKIQMPQMRQLMTQDQFRLVRLQHVLCQIDRRNQTGKARRFDRAGNIDARSAALAEKTPVAVQPNRKHRPRAEQPESEQCAAAEPGNLKNLCRRQRLCSRFRSFLYRGDRLLRRCLRFRHGLCGSLNHRCSLHGPLCALRRNCRVLCRKNRQRNQCSRQAEFQKHDQPKRIEHPLRHAVFEYRPHQKNNRYQRGNGQNFFQHEDSSCFSAASKMAFSS